MAVNERAITEKGMRTFQAYHSLVHQVMLNEVSDIKQYISDAQLRDVIGDKIIDLRKLMEGLG